MSKIMDLYAEVNDIDDLKPVKPVYNKEFFEIVKKSDEERAIRKMLEKARGRDRQEVEDWLYARAEWEWGENDEGHYEMYFNNFEAVCEEAATDLMDAYIEEQAFDVTDEQYNHMIEVVRDNLANMWADIECDCIERCKQDTKDERELEDDYYRATCRGLHEQENN